MKLIIPFFCLFSLISFSTFAESYPRAEEREKWLKVIADYKPQVFQVIHAEEATPSQKALLDYVQTQVWPKMVKLSYNSMLGSLYYVAVDRALYNDDKEKETWQNEQVRLANEESQITTSKEWKENLKTMNTLAKDLKGPLADWFRKMYADDQISGFSEKQLPLLERLNKLDVEITNVANSSPISKDLGRFQKEKDEILRQFYSKKISFQEATQKMESLQTISFTAHGQFIANKAKAFLNEAAIIRSQLAKSKGFPNWAEFSLAAKKDYYSKGFQTPKERIRFLQDFLKSTKQVHQDLLVTRIKDTPGAKFEDLRISQSELLKFEGDSLLKDYFPVNQVEAVWKKTMKESGFSTEVIDRIQFDNYPREGKQTHAYMMPAALNEPQIFLVDATQLKAVLPTPDPVKDPSGWNLARIYIVENMRTDGLDAYSTLFHEGGHGLDYSHRMDIYGFGQDSSYTETHSMTMEMFFEDYDFIMAVAKDKQEQAPSSELVKTYLENTKLNKLVNFRGQIYNALYDLLIWNREYKEGDDFVGNMASLSDRLSNTYFFAKQGKVISGVDSRYRYFSIHHFYGGSVRYIGYNYAQMAANMTYVKLLNELKKQTGRRTLYNQPGLAKILVDGYYRFGFLKTFPKSIIDFTGQPFDSTKEADRLSNELKEIIKNRSTPNCNKLRF